MPIYGPGSCHLIAFGFTQCLSAIIVMEKAVSTRKVTTSLATGSNSPAQETLGAVIVKATASPLHVAAARG